MICAVDSVDYIKPFMLGIFFGAFFTFTRMRRPPIREIERIKKLRLGQ